jgi:MYXO-CTERM domain-containing protein
MSVPSPLHRLILLCCALLPLQGSAQLRTGVYEGAGHVPLMVTGLGFRPDVVIVKADLSVGGALSTSTMPPGITKTLSESGALVTDGVVSLDDDGFTVMETSWRVNRKDSSYAWAAFRADPDELVVGTYVGDGREGRHVRALSWRPGLLFIVAEASAPLHWRTSAMPTGTSFQAGETPLHLGRILDFDDRGFFLGAHPAVNAEGTTYHYVAFRPRPDGLHVGSYRGDGAPDRKIGPAGPAELVLLKPNASTHLLFRPRALEGERTPYFFALPHASDRIGPLGDDGVRVGAHSEVNAVDVEHYFAIWSAGPRARLNVTPGNGPAPLTVQLDGSASTPGAGATISEWHWHQPEGPGGVALSASGQQQVTLTHPGRYVFELAITDSEGRRSAPVRLGVEVDGEVYRPDPALGCAVSSAPPWILPTLLLLLMASRRRRRELS